MIKIDYLKFILLFIIVVLLQALIFNNLTIETLFNCIPVIYIYFILTLPFETKSVVVILLGFLIGLTIDIFCNTLGINAAATTFVAFLRQPVMKLFLRDQEDVKNKIPCIHVLGWSIYLKYSIVLVSLQILSIALLEYLDIYNWSLFIPRILCSIVLSILIIIAIDLLFNNSSNNE